MKNIEKLSYLLRRDLESSKRRLVWNQDIEESYDKKYRYVTNDERLLSFAQDRICMTSDCFILYALAHMGVADGESISIFLESLVKKNPSLNIVYKKDKNALEERMKVLAKMGLIFAFYYDTDISYNNVEEVDRKAIYTMGGNGYDIVKQRLQKRLNVNDAIQYKPLQELIGWAAAAYVGVNIANQSMGFVDYMERVIRTKHVGTVYFPMEIKTVVGETSYYIAVISSFLNYDPFIHTERSYHEFCAFKLNAIKNYLYIRATKGSPVVVVAVYDNADLMEFSRMIYSTELLQPYLEQIYFTGEGIIRERNGEVANGFLRMIMDSNEDIGYRFEYVNAPFMQ